MTRLNAEGADPWLFGIEQSIFAAPHTPNFRLLSLFNKSGPDRATETVVRMLNDGECRQEGW